MVTLPVYVQFNTNKLVDAGIDIAVILLIAWYLHHDAFDIFTVFKFDNDDVNEVFVIYDDKVELQYWCQTCARSI